MNLHSLSEKDLRAIVDRPERFETEVVDRDGEGLFDGKMIIDLKITLRVDC